MAMVALIVPHDLASCSVINRNSIRMNSMQSEERMCGQIDTMTMTMIASSIESNNTGVN